MGYCVMATAFFRYLSICHPFYEVPKNFHRRLSFVLLAVIGLSLSGMALAVVFDERFFFDADSIPRYYSRHKTGVLDLLDCLAISN